MRRRRPLALALDVAAVLSAWIWPAAGGATPLPACDLPNSVPADRRSDITLLNETVPLGIQVLSWPSAAIMANMFGILVSEALGVNVVLHDAIPSSTQALWGLGGCVPQQTGTEGVCGAQELKTHHVLLEAWGDGISTSEASVKQRLGARMPVRVGSVGYDGFETSFVPSGPREAALGSSGLALDFYRSYNRSWHDPARHFQKYTDVSLDGLLPCSATRLYDTANIQHYVRHTGDTDGVEVVGGRLVAKCSGGASGSWWFSPQCRQNPDTCIPLIDAGDGWFLEANMQRAAVHGMPVALAVATWSKYASMKGDTLLYWWSPDNTFISLRPSPIIFPDHNPDEWNNGFTATDSEKVFLGKWAHYALSAADQRVVEVLDLMSVSLSRIEAMLLETKRNKTEHQVACEYLQANRAWWSPWIPSETRCSKGFGLVDAAGQHVQDRSLATSCDWCQPGTASTALEDDKGDTRVCTLCPTGRHQPKPGQIDCLPCDVGTFAPSEGFALCAGCAVGSASDVAGASDCKLCGRGSFQAVTGMTACETCAGGTFKDAAGATACEICPTGMYSSIGSTECTNCSAGEIAATAGSSECVGCGPGYFAEAVGMSTCSRCSVGTFAAGEGHSACTSCADGAPRWTTMRRLRLASGEELWASTDAAVSEDDCGCEIGSRLDGAGGCVSCEEEEGVDCLGMGEVLVLPGYYSPANLSIFKCRNEARCPGGVPGSTCASGRVGVSCTTCADGMAPGDYGKCMPCTDGDVVPFIFACLFVVFACFLLYGVFERSNQSHSSHATLLVGVSSGLMLGMLQQLSVMGLVNVSYVEPMETFLKLVKVVAFDIDEVLRLGCVGSWTSVTRYGTKLALVLASTVIVGIAHVIVVIVRHRGRFGERRATLVAVLGTLSLIFYTSVTVVMLQPFDCQLHPNGMWTVSSYEDIVCWSQNSSQHTSMTILATFALTIPISNFAIAVMLVRRYPEAVRRRNTQFLRSFGFLFFRFRPEVHWYILVLLTRSFFIGLVPVLPRASAQIYLLQISLIISFATVIHFKPWRMRSLNWLDVVFGTIMLVVLNIASFMAVMSPDDTKVIGWLCVTLAVLVLLVIPTLVSISVFRHLGGSARRYHFFLCHYKNEAGAFARWLKIELASSPLVSRDIFLDSDNLESLDQLLNFVACDVQAIIVLSSRSVYQRPWCIGEMATAEANGVASVVLALPDHEEAIDCSRRLSSLEGLDVESLHQNGIDLAAIRHTIETFSAKPAIRLPPCMSDASMRDLVGILARGEVQGELKEAQEPVLDPSTVILASLEDFEAVASANILRVMLVPHLGDVGWEIPWVLEQGQHLPESTEKVLIVFTPGCLADADFLGHVVSARLAPGLQIVPVIADDEFRVPGRDTIASFLGEDPGSRVRCGATVEEIMAAVLDVFKEIAVIVSAKRSSAPVLEAAVSNLAQRLRPPKLCSTRSETFKRLWPRGLSSRVALSRSDTDGAHVEPESDKGREREEAAAAAAAAEEEEEEGESDFGAEAAIRPAVSSKWRSAEVPADILRDLAKY